MNLLSAIIQALPDAMPAVRDAVRALPGAEIHIDSGDGRLVITLESPSYRAVIDHLTQISILPGVLAANPVYQYADPQDSDANNDSPEEERTP
ncbi:MAG: chaperone NapD [Magnetococcus sp. WYHC-3]